MICSRLLHAESVLDKRQMTVPIMSLRRLAHVKCRSDTNLNEL